MIQICSKTACLHGRGYARAGNRGICWCDSTTARETWSVLQRSTWCLLPQLALFQYVKKYVLVCMILRDFTFLIVFVCSLMLLAIVQEVRVCIACTLPFTCPTQGSLVQIAKFFSFNRATTPKPGVPRLCACAALPPRPRVSRILRAKQAKPTSKLREINEPQLTIQQSIHIQSLSHHSTSVPPINSHHASSLAAP